MAATRRLTLGRVAARILAAVDGAANELDYERRRAAVDRNFQLAQKFIDQRSRMEAAINAEGTGGVWGPLGHMP